MYLFAFALRHPHAPLTIREKFSITNQHIKQAYDSLNSIANIYPSVNYKNSFILSTCNRSEIYIYLSDNNTEHVLNWWADFCRQPLKDLKKYVDIYAEEKAVFHFFEVACGADSMVLGETQISKQIKDAYAQAQSISTLSPYLHSIIQKSLNCSKEVRTKTNIGKFSISFASAGITLAQHIFTHMHKQNMLFIGAGEMMQTLAAHFSLQNPQKITIANRSFENAQDLVKMRLQNYTGRIEIQSLENVKNLLAESDITVCCIEYTNNLLINSEDIQKSLKKRRYKPMYLLDLSVPLVIDAGIKKLSDAFFYNVDDLSYIIENGQSKRNEAKKEAEQIIIKHIQQFDIWKKNYTIKPLISKIQNKLNKQMQACLNDNNSTEAVLQKFMQYNLHNLLQLLPDLTQEQQDKFNKYLDD